MNKYALILLEDFNYESLNGITYPVILDYNDKWKMVEYTDEPDPVGDGWIIFNSNIECIEFLKNDNE